MNIKVVGIVGSLRPGSHTRKAVQLALDGATQTRATTELIDLAAYDLIFADRKYRDDDAPPNVLALRQAVRGAQGIILGTPEYHGSFSGVIKNALDLMGFEEFGGKILGLVGVAGGTLGAVNALTGLQMVGRSLHAWIYPRMVSIPQAWSHFDREGRLTDPRIADRLEDLGRQVAKFAALHTSEKHADFIKAWEAAQPNPGG